MSYFYLSERGPIESTAQGDYGTPISQAEYETLMPPVLAPDWPPVRTALLQDADYNAAVDAANQRAATRLEQYAMGNPNDWAMLALLWNAMVGSIPAPNPLTPAVCDRLNDLFQGNHLPVTLNRDTALMNAP
jgi:hypothetical protein